MRYIAVLWGCNSQNHNLLYRKEKWGKSLSIEKTLNELLVDLFHEIIDIEEKFIRKDKKYSKMILDYTNKGYNFVITLDGTTKSVEDVEKLKMFKYVIAPQKLVLYKELKQNKSILKNVVFN